MPLMIKTTGIEQYAPGGGGSLKMLLVGGPGVGKGHPLSTELLTPGGYQALGKLQVGDEVIGSDGRPTAITAIYERGILPIRRVTFNDGTEVLVDAEHLWQVDDRHGWKVVETDRLGSLTRTVGDDEVLKFRIPQVRPVQHPAADLPLHPYVLGTLLANGHFSDHVQLTIPFGPEWSDQVAAIYELTPDWMRVAEVTRRTNATARQFHLHDCLDIITELGLARVLSPQKWIPQNYLFASEDQRRWLLAGLMDCDGGVKGRWPWYYSTSLALATDVAELVRSLGGHATVVTQVRTTKPTEYNVRIGMTSNPFRYGPKVGRWKPAQRTDRRIASITDAGYDEVRCITVAAEDSLYVTENHIVTHNTRMSSFWPKPIYADCEGGLASVADRKVPFVSVNSTQDMLDFLHYMKLECRRPYADRQYQTVVIDTLDAFHRKVKDEWLQANPGQSSFRGFEAWGFLETKMQMLLTRLLNLDCNVIVNCHFKDKTIKEGTGDSAVERQELMLQLQGDVKDSVYNDFDLVGYFGTFFAAEDGQRVQKRGITFHPTPEKPFLKDRLHITPPWMEVTFSDDDYANLFAAFTARLDDLADSTDVAVIPSEVPESAPRPVSAGNGPVAPIDPDSLPLVALDKASLVNKARTMGIKFKTNALKSELIGMIEEALAAKAADAKDASPQPEVEKAHTTPAAAPEPTPAPTPAPVTESNAPAELKSVAAQALQASKDVASAAGHSPQPADQPEPEITDLSSLLEEIPEDVEAASALVESTLGGQVLSDEGGADRTPMALDNTIAPTPAAAPEAPATNPKRPCMRCGVDVTGDNQNLVQMAWIRHRLVLCGEHYLESKAKTPPTWLGELKAQAKTA